MAIQSSRWECPRGDVGTKHLEVPAGRRDPRKEKVSPNAISTTTLLDPYKMQSIVMKKKIISIYFFRSIEFDFYSGLKTQ